MKEISRFHNSFNSTFFNQRRAAEDMEDIHTVPPEWQGNEDTSRWSRRKREEGGGVRGKAVDSEDELASVSPAT